MSFGNDLAKFRRATMEKHSKVKRTAILNLFSAIVIGTPVDKGVLVNNWYVEIGQPSRKTTDDRDPTRSEPKERAERVLADLDSDRAHEDVFITNNLPYAARIEYDGHSGKAPQGMVRVNTARWSGFVGSAARKVNNEQL